MTTSDMHNTYPTPTEDQMIGLLLHIAGSKLCHYILTVFTTHLHTVTQPRTVCLSTVRQAIFAMHE